MIDRQTIYKHSLTYLQEVFEAWIGISIAYYIMCKGDFKKDDFKITIKMSLIVGFATFILEEFNPSIKKDIRNNAFFAVRMIPTN